MNNQKFSEKKAINMKIGIFTDLVLCFSPLFQSITFNIIDLVNPLAYFIDIFNVSLGGSSIFGDVFIFIDFGVLIISGDFCLLIAFFFHSRTLKKRILVDNDV